MGKTRDAKWTIEDSSDLYNLDRWGCGFFGIDHRGHLVADFAANSDRLSILDAVNFANQQGYDAPFIVRYPDIIRCRISQINNAFQNAISQFQYGGSYRCFYPAKVNQHREVIQAAVEGGSKFGGGVEAGSKAELFALLLSTDNDIPVLCNGFKDETIIEMAFRAQQLGRKITIVLEKPDELELVINCARRFDIQPNLGVRIKLAVRSGGRWSASGGAKSKFGLTTCQLTKIVSRLDSEGLLHCLTLLHFHPGSQISNVRKIKASIIEAARIYSDLVRNNVPLNTIDVGGGLAIDYTGERNTDPSSKNYTLEEYANDVVYYIQQVCQQSGVADPDIISESGRAITAHHSILVVPVLENHQAGGGAEFIDETVCESAPVVRELREILNSVNAGNLSESFHDAEASIEAVWQMFSHGTLSLKQRSCAEQLVQLIYRKVASMLGELDFVPSELEDLRHQLADTYVLNFSLFQALPDSWAINQVFPVVPIHRLTERPSQRAIIGDITCDSDGKIDCFIGSQGRKNSLPLHQLDDQPYYLGIFLIGAYQEALGDDHNLMGDFHVISVASDGQIEVRRGATTMDVLGDVHYRKKELAESLNASIDSAFQHSRITDNDGTEIRSFFVSVMESYTYLKPNGPTTKPRIPKLHIGKELLPGSKSNG